MEVKSDDVKPTSQHVSFKKKGCRNIFNYFSFLRIFFHWLGGYIVLGLFIFLYIYRFGDHPHGLTIVIVLNIFIGGNLFCVTVMCVWLGFNYHPFILKFFYAFDRPTLWKDMNRTSPFFVEQEEQQEEGKTRSFELYLTLRFYKTVVTTEYAHQEAFEKTEKVLQKEEELPIKNFSCTSNFKSLQTEFKAIKKTLEPPQGNTGISISVNNRVHVNYSPELRKYIKDSKEKLLDQYSYYGSNFEVSDHWRYKAGKIKLTKEDPETWQFISNDQSLVEKLRVRERYLRCSFFFAPLFELMLGLVVGKLTIPLEYFVEFTGKTSIGSLESYDFIIQEVQKILESTTDNEVKEHSKKTLMELEEMAASAESNIALQNMGRVEREKDEKARPLYSSFLAYVEKRSITNNNKTNENKKGHIALIETNEFQNL